MRRLEWHRCVRSVLHRVCDVPRRLELLVLNRRNLICRQNVNGWCKPSLRDDRRDDGRTDDGSNKNRELLLVDDARVQAIQR